MDDNQQKETLFEKHKENIYFRWGLTAFVVIVACIIVAQFVTRLTSVFGVVGELAGLWRRSSMALASPIY